MNRQEQWREIEQLSEAMLEAARHQQWEDVSAQESLRRVLIGEFFAIQATADETPWLESSLQRVLAIDQELMALGRGEQARIAAELTQIASGKRAANAYIKNT